jgi:phospholipase/carboxylesterase
MSSIPALDGPRVQPLSGRAPTSMVILAHGYGSNGEDLIGLAPYWRELLADTIFIAPNAPQPCPGAPGMFQWWPVWDMDRKVGIHQAAPVLDAFIDAELARYGLTEDRLALVGFSQGTMMSLHVGPRRAKEIAGIVGYSGMLVDPDPAEILTHPPVLLAHGDADPMVPIAAFHQADAALKQLGFQVSTHVSRGLGHSLDMDGLRLGGEFLSEALA